MPRKYNTQKKLHIRKGDMVRVISGNEKGREGKVLKVFRQKERIIVEGVNVRIRHTRPTQLYPQGGRIEREAKRAATWVVGLVSAERSVTGPVTSPTIRSTRATLGRSP